MEKLVAFLLISIITYGHLLLLMESWQLAPKFVSYRPAGFAALWVGGVFVKFIDLR